MTEGTDTSGGTNPTDPSGKALETWRVEVDRDRCMGSGGCVYALPRVFAMGDDGLATVVGEVDSDDELVRDVIGECPTEALRLVRSQLLSLPRSQERRDAGADVTNVLSAPARR